MANSISGVGASSASRKTLDVVPGEDLGGGPRRAVGEEAAVVADQHALVLALLAHDEVGQRLAEPPDVAEVEAFPDHGPPAARPEPDQVGFLVGHRTHGPLLQDELGLLAVGVGVDAEHFAAVVDLVAFHPPPGPDELVDDVGQADMGAIRQGAQGRKERFRAHDVGPDVQLANVAEGPRRVFFLDDIHDQPAAVAHDAAIGQRHVGDGGQQGQIHLAQAVAGDEALDRDRANQGRVAVEDQHIAGMVGQSRGRLQNGMARAQLRFLHDVLVIRAKVGLELILLKADDQDRLLGRDVARRRIQDVVHDRAIVQQLQRLEVGLACPVARPGGQDHGFERGGVGFRLGRVHTRSSWADGPAECNNPSIAIGA